MGARFRYLARLAGQQFGLVREVTEHAANRRQPVKTVSSLLRFGGARTSGAIQSGTGITLTGDGRAGGCLGLAALLLCATQRSLRSNIANLKRLLEGQPQA